jgi:hypothetical protein
MIVQPHDSWRVQEVIASSQSHQWRLQAGQAEASFSKVVYLAPRVVVDADEVQLLARVVASHAQCHDPSHDAPEDERRDRQPALHLSEQQRYEQEEDLSVHVVTFGQEEDLFLHLTS